MRLNQLKFSHFRVALLALLVALLGCGDTERPTASGDPFPVPAEALRADSTGRHGGEVNYPLPGEPNSFNVTAVTEARTQLLTYLLTGTLLEFDRKEQLVREGLIRHWEFSEDGRSVLLSLRSGVHFSDGSPVTAEDVVFTFERLLEPASRNSIRPSLQFDGQPLEVEKRGDTQVLVRFPKASAAAEYVLTTIPILPKHLLDDTARKIEEFWNLGTRPEEMAGLGPFMLEEHVPGEKTILTRNPHYWKVDHSGRRLPYLDRLVIHYVADRNTQLLRFRAGELDLLDYQLRPEDFLELEASESGSQLINAGASTHLTFMWFNLGASSVEGNAAAGVSHALPWFQDVRFRRAVAGAVSREAIVRNVFLGQASPAYSIMPGTVQAWHWEADPEDRHRNPAQLLSQAGFRRREEGGKSLLLDSSGRAVEFTLLTRADDVWGRIAALIQQDLEPLGIRLSIVMEDFRSVTSRVAGRDYEAALLAVIVPYEPADQLDTFLSSGSRHLWNPSQPVPATPWEAEVDRLMLRQVTTLDPALRRELYREAQKLLVDNVAIVPLVNRDVLVAAAPGIRNLRPANLYPNSLWNAWELCVDE